MRFKTFLEIGKITSTHGIRGFVKIVAWCDDVYVFKSLSFLYFDEKGISKKKIEEVKFLKNFVLILFSDIKSINDAKNLTGKIIYVDRKDLKLEEGAVFISDLIGVEIVDYLDGTCYGKIVDVLKTGANDVYKIIDENKNEKFIPVIKDVIIKRDLDENKIYIKLLEGLFDV